MKSVTHARVCVAAYVWLMSSPANVRAEPLPIPETLSPLQRLILEEPDSARGRSAAELRRRLALELRVRFCACWPKTKRQTVPVAVTVETHAASAARVVAVTVKGLSREELDGAFHRCSMKATESLSGWKVEDADARALGERTTQEEFIVRRSDRQAKCPGGR